MSGEDDSWVFDSLVAFLNGPIWNAPLQSFVEEKSLSKTSYNRNLVVFITLIAVFEPNVTENDDYRKIFEEFKNLVIQLQ